MQWRAPRLGLENILHSLEVDGSSETDLTEGEIVEMYSVANSPDDWREAAGELTEAVGSVTCCSKSQLRWTTDEGW